jgi:D-3-phosphoglycerate dehydrogenase
MLGKILIGSRSFGKFTPKGLKMLEDNNCEVIQNSFGHALSEKELLDIASEVDAIITGMDQLSEKVINSLKKLKVISKHGVGIDNINIKAANSKNIIVTSIPAGIEECNAVADFTFALMLSIARKICEADNNTKKEGWVKFIGSEVYGKTIGVIGGGSIGKAVIVRAKGFGMDILVYDVKKDKKIVDEFDARYVDLKYLLNNSDYVTIHVPLNKSTNGLIKKRELGFMKKNSYLINTARGGIVNEKDLYEALKAEKIAGAALDVFCKEPPGKNPLLELKNLITTSHMAAYTQSSLENLDLISAENVVKVLKGLKPQENYIVNKELFSDYPL